MGKFNPREPQQGEMLPALRLPNDSSCRGFRVASAKDLIKAIKLLKEEPPRDTWQRVRS